MFSYKLLLVCIMLIHCILSMPAGDDVPEQGADIETAEHKHRYYGGYGGYYRPYYYSPYYYGGYRGHHGYYGGYWG